MGGEDGIEGGR